MTSTTMKPTAMNATRRLAALPRLGAIAAALILAGCSVTPTLVSQDEVKNRISADTAQMYAEPRVALVLLERLCQDDVTCILAHDHDAILVVYDLFGAPSKVAKCRIVRLYERLCRERLQLKLRVLVP